MSIHVFIDFFFALLVVYRLDLKPDVLYIKEVKSVLLNDVPKIIRGEKFLTDYGHFTDYGFIFWSVTFSVVLLPLFLLLSAHWPLTSYIIVPIVTVVGIGGIFMTLVALLYSGFVLGSYPEQGWSRILLTVSHYVLVLWGYFVIWSYSNTFTISTLVLMYQIQGLVLVSFVVLFYVILPLFMTGCQSFLMVLQCEYLTENVMDFQHYGGSDILNKDHSDEQMEWSNLFVLNFFFENVLEAFIVVVLYLSDYQDIFSTLFAIPTVMNVSVRLTRFIFRGIRELTSDSVDVIKNKDGTYKIVPVSNA